MDSTLMHCELQSRVLARTCDVASKVENGCCISVEVVTKMRHICPNAFCKCGGYTYVVTYWRPLSTCHISQSDLLSPSMHLTCRRSRIPAMVDGLRHQRCEECEVHMKAEGSELRKFACCSLHESLTSHDCGILNKLLPPHMKVFPCDVKIRLGWNK